MKQNLFRFLLLSLIVLLQISAFKQPLPNNDYLIKNNWGREYKTGTEITFNKDYTYTAFIDYGMDFMRMEGIYEINQDKIILYEKDSKKIFLNNGTLMFDPDGVKYIYYLYFEDGTKVYNLNSGVKEGTEITLLNEFKSITMGIKDADVTTNVKFRTIPDINGEIIEIYVLKETEDGMPEEEKLTYVPAQTRIHVLARTKNKFKIKEWYNYWYYVEVPDSYGFNYLKGWMFAEFVKILN